MLREGREAREQREILVRLSRSGQWIEPSAWGFTRIAWVKQQSLSCHINEYDKTFDETGINKHSAFHRIRGSKYDEHAKMSHI